VQESEAVPRSRLFCVCCVSQDFGAEHVVYRIAIERVSTTVAAVKEPSCRCAGKTAWPGVA
jgi:hypothetical protein